MQSLEEKILAQLEAAIEDYGFQPLLVGGSGDGHISIQSEAIGEHASVYYRIDSEYVTFRLTFLGKKIPSQPGRNDYFDFYLKHTEIDKIAHFFGCLEQNLERLRKQMGSKKKVVSSL